MGFLAVVFWAVMLGCFFFCLLVICFGGFCFVLHLLGSLVLFQFGLVLVFGWFFVCVI